MRLLALFTVLCLFACPQLCQAGDTYAAIAYSPDTGRYGKAHGYSTRAAAESAAIGFCNRPDARIVAWAKNAYCALALGDDDGAYGIGYSTNREEARAYALRNAEKRTTNCYIAVLIGSDD